MLLKRILCVLFAVIFTLTLCSCKSAKDDTPTGSITDNGDTIQVDIIPADPKDVASAAADYKPDDGYKYEKSDTTIADDDYKADGYILSAKDDKNKSVACVYYEQSDVNSMEIDVMTKDATDADLEAAIKMVRSLILSTFENFPLDSLNGNLPLTVVEIRRLIVNNAQVEDIIYGRDSDVSISYYFEPKGGALIYRIEI